MDFPFTMPVFPYQNNFYPKEGALCGRQGENVLSFYHEYNICICYIYIKSKFCKITVLLFPLLVGVQVEMYYLLKCFWKLDMQINQTRQN